MIFISTLTFSFYLMKKHILCPNFCLIYSITWILTRKFMHTLYNNFSKIPGNRNKKTISRCSAKVYSYKYQNSRRNRIKIFINFLLKTTELKLFLNKSLRSKDIIKKRGDYAVCPKKYFWMWKICTWIIIGDTEF